MGKGEGSWGTEGRGGRGGVEGGVKVGGRTGGSNPSTGGREASSASLGCCMTTRGGMKGVRVSRDRKEKSAGD